MFDAFITGWKPMLPYLQRQRSKGCATFRIFVAIRRRAITMAGTSSGSVIMTSSRKIRPSILAIALVACTSALLWCIARAADAKLRDDAFAQMDLVVDQVNKALYGLAVDNCGYYLPPDSAALLDEVPPDYPLSFAIGPTDIKYRHRRKAEKPRLYPDWYCLTSPVAYSETLPMDPFAPGEPLGYCAQETLIINFLGAIRSVGPDGDRDLDMVELRRRFQPYIFDGAKPEDKYQYSPWNDEQRMAHMRRSVREVVDPAMYDPTNGVDSSGDLIVVYLTFEPVYGWKLPNTGWNDPPAIGPTSSGPTIPEAIEHEPGSGLRRVFWTSSIEPLLRRFESDPAGWAAQVDATKNRLQGDFGDVLIAPRALNPRELTSLESWRKEPDSWCAVTDAIVAAFPGNERNHSSIDGSSVAMMAAMPTLMELLSLRASEELARGNTAEADRIVEMMWNINWNAIGVHDVYSWGNRVAEDSWRVYARWRKAVDAVLRQQPGSSSGDAAK